MLTWRHSSCDILTAPVPFISWTASRALDSLLSQGTFSYRIPQLSCPESAARHECALHQREHTRRGTKIREKNREKNETKDMEKNNRKKKERKRRRREERG
jgi:hypothetical protein